MSMRPIKKGSTDQSVVIRIIDSTDGTPENAVEHNTSGIDLWYRREGATKTSITEAALASLDAAHSDGGIELISDGYYRLDLPDAAFASSAGVNGVMIGGTVTGMIVVGTYVPLVAYDPYDSVRAGLTALPNAAADAAGGLPISDAGGLDMDAILADTNELQGDWVNGGRLDLIVDELTTQGDTNEGKLDTIAGYLDTEVAAILEDTGTTIPGLISALNDPTAAAIADAVWDEAATGHTDAGKAGAQLWTDIDAILADTNELQTDDVPGLIAALNNITANDVWDATSATLSLSWETITDRIYRFLMNKMNITDASGAVALRNEGDSGDLATQTITDNSTTTVRTALTWA